MESLDNMLFSSAPDQSPKPGFSKKIMGRLAWQRLRRNLSIIIGLGLLSAIPLMLRAHAGQMLGYAVHKTDIVLSHPLLFARAIAESVPWPLAIGIAITFCLMVILRRAFGLLVVARASGAFTAAGFLMVGSTAAFASSTTNSHLGPAQQQLRLIVNGIGQPSVAIDGVTYKFQTNADLTDAQIQAFAEFQRTVTAATAADRANSIPDTYLTGVAEIRVNTITPAQLTYTYADSNSEPVSQKTQTIRVSPKTIFLVGGEKSTITAIKPGDLVLLNSFINGDAILVGKLTHPLRDYGIIGYSTTTAAHRTDGRCYGNAAEKCPNIPAAYTMLDMSDSYENGDLYKTSPAAGKQLIEIYGSIANVTQTNVTLKTQTGTVWTMNLGTVISDANRLKLDIKPGDHLRVEVWTSPADRQTHLLHDLSLDAGRTMEVDYDESAGSIFNMVQLVLHKPWHYGQTAEKY